MTFDEAAIAEQEKSKGRIPPALLGVKTPYHGYSPASSVGSTDDRRSSLEGGALEESQIRAALHGRWDDAAGQAGDAGEMGRRGMMRLPESAHSQQV